MSERRKIRSRSTQGPILDQHAVQSIIGPHTDISAIQILDLSHSNVATKLGMAPAEYSPTLQGDLLSVLSNVTSLDLRGYNWRSVDLFTESPTLRKLDLRGNQIEASALKRLLSLLPGLELLLLSDVPYKHPTELFLALQYSPGPSLAGVSRSLKIRINTIERLWSALLNEVSRVKLMARKEVENLLDDDTCVVIEEVLVEELKQRMLQKLKDPNKEKEGYKQMYESLIHEKATNLASGQSARVKSQLQSMDDADKLRVKVHVSNCGSDCKCHNEGLSLELLPSQLKEALQSAMSVNPAWHVTRMGRATNQVNVGVKRPRDDTAQVRVSVSKSKNGKSIEHVTPAPSADTLAHVIRCRSDIGQYQSTLHKSKAIVRTSVVRRLPHSRANRVPFDKLSPHEKLEAVDQLLKTIKL